MKHFFLLAILAFFLAPAGKAQYLEFAPDGAEWFYAYQSEWSPDNGFMHAQNLGDTLLGGRLCKKICISHHTMATAPPYCDSTAFFLYLHQQADSIFKYAPAFEGGFQLLFRNNYQIGDSVFYAAHFVVTNIDTVYFNEQPVRRFYLTNTSTGNVVLIFDRFGPNNGLFDPWEVIGDDGIINLRCYQDQAFPQTQVNGESCELILQVEEPRTAVRIYPNPAQDQLHVELDGYRNQELRLRVWSVAGNLVLDQLIQADGSPVNIRTLPSGFYLFAIQAGEAIVQQKFIKN